MIPDYTGESNVITLGPLKSEEGRKVIQSDVTQMEEGHEPENAGFEAFRSW